MGIHHTEFDTKAGALCLSFANSFDINVNGKHEEMLKEYADLVDWAQILEVIDTPIAQLLLKEANKRPEDAYAVLQAAWTLRQSIFNAFASIAHGKPPAPHDLDELNKSLSNTLTHQRILSHEKGFIWGWDDGAALDQIVWPVVRDAADLLTSDMIYRVGQCANVSGCGWLFTDTSRNRSRRWCSMETCGNRAKAKRHYRRIKE